VSWYIEIVTGSPPIEKVTRKPGFKSRDEAIAWMKANVARPEYEGALFHISQDDPTYRGPMPEQVKKDFPGTRH